CQNVQISRSAWLPRHRDMPSGLGRRVLSGPEPIELRVLGHRPHRISRRPTSRLVIPAKFGPNKSPAALLEKNSSPPLRDTAEFQPNQTLLRGLKLHARASSMCLKTPQDREPEGDFLPSDHRE